MADRTPPRTLLEKIIREGDHTLEEWCELFEATARSMREKAALSIRQLQRWMAGQVDNARPSARRVAARLWQHPFPVLLAPPGTVVITAPGAPDRNAVDDGADIAVSSVLEAVTIMAAHESSRHAADSGGSVSPTSIEQVQAEVWRLARRYAELSPLLLLSEARQARDLAYAALDRTRRPAQTADLYLAAGQLCGLMAVASFDLAVWDAAAEQARAAHVYAELVDHAGLRSWARGTQALIAYWTGRPRQALLHVEAGLDSAPAGAAEARLRCIEARAWSHIGGDSRNVSDALRHADTAHDADSGGDDLHDEIGGEFGWGPSRHAACAGTALLAIGDAAGAVERARTALTLLPDDPLGGLVAERAHIDLAAAELALGRLDAADAALEPVWDVPVPQRRHSLTDRLTQMAHALATQTWRDDRQAWQLRDRIEVFNTEAQARALPSANRASLAGSRPCSACRSCGTGCSTCNHCQVSITVSRSGRQVRPACWAREASTAQVPGGVRHSGISVHCRTSCSASQSAATQTSSAAAPVASTHALSRSPYVACPSGAATLNTPPTPASTRPRVKSVKSRTSTGWMG